MKFESCKRKKVESVDKLLTVQEVSEILGATEKVVKYTLNLPYVKVAGKRMYEKKDIENFIKKNKHYTIDIITYQKSNKKREYVV